MSNFVGTNCSSFVAATASCNATLNATVSREQEDLRDEYVAIWEVAILAVMFVVAVAGNSLVIVALYFRQHDAPRKNVTRMYFFILHLSIADLLTALLNVLPQLFWEITFRFQGGPILCKLVKFGQPLGPYLSSYVLTVTALDRYQAVCHPLNYCSVTSRRSKIMVYLAWVLSLVFCIPQLVIFSYQETSEGFFECWGTFDPPSGERAYVTWYSISVFIFPLLVLIYTYASICIAIWRNSGIIGEARDPKGGLLRERPAISRAKINSVKQMIAVISFYAASSSPFVASLLWVTWDPDASTSPFFSDVRLKIINTAVLAGVFAGAAFAILTLMSSLNSCVNPWIYLALNRELWRALVVRFWPSRTGNTSSQSRKNQNKSIDIGRCGSSASSSGISDKSYVSRMSHYANGMLARSNSLGKELHLMTNLRH